MDELMKNRWARGFVWFSIWFGFGGILSNFITFSWLSLVTSLTCFYLYFFLWDRYFRWDNKFVPNILEEYKKKEQNVRT